MFTAMVLTMSIRYPYMLWVYLRLRMKFSSFSSKLGGTELCDTTSSEDFSTPRSALGTLHVS